jgi:hypothetical protein
MVIPAGTGYETVRGTLFGSTGAALKGVRVIDGSGNPVIGFSRMQSDDGTYYQEQEYGEVIITNGTVGTRLQIYDTTNNTELYNDIPASFPFTYTDYTLPVPTRDIRVRAMYVSGATAKKFIDEEIGTVSAAAPSLSYRLNQANDQVYIDNAIDGSTVTDVTIDDALLLVEVNTGSISWPTLYAYETYWLSTETGIRDEGRFMIAADVANYQIFGFKIKNVTSPAVPLVIVDGYGVDGDTGDPLDILDTTGGTIYCAPPHVVAYSTGGGGGGASAADVWTYASRTLTSGGATAVAAATVTALHANTVPVNVAKVNGYTIDGAGTEQDPWGPV